MAKQLNLGMLGALPPDPGRLHRKNEAAGSAPRLPLGLRPKHPWGLRPRPSPECGLGWSPNGVWGGAPAGVWGRSPSFILAAEPLPVSGGGAPRNIVS